MQSKLTWPLLAAAVYVASASVANATCLTVDWGNATFGGSWVNNCNYLVTVRWDDDKCNWDCLIQVGAYNKVSAGIWGNVRWVECEGYCNPQP